MKTAFLLFLFTCSFYSLTRSEVFCPVPNQDDQRFRRLKSMAIEILGFDAQATEGQDRNYLQNRQWSQIQTKGVKTLISRVNAFKKKHAKNTAVNASVILNANNTILLMSHLERNLNLTFCVIFYYDKQGELQSVKATYGLSTPDSKEVDQGQKEAQEEKTR